MRITQRQRQAILVAARRAFGHDVSVRLFGSRTNDELKGGDFDLYVECDSKDAEWLIQAKMKFLCELDKSTVLTGEKIDIVLATPLHREPRKIDQVARHEGVRL